MRCPGLAAALCLLAIPAAGDDFAGPVAARVVEVLDGDTFVADALIWPGQTLRINVRIRGIDAPEIHARCPAEREAALRARDALSALIRDRPVVIGRIGGAKYYGRVLADVWVRGDEPVAAKLVASGVARAYGGGRRAGWC